MSAVGEGRTAGDLTVVLRPVYIVTRYIVCWCLVSQARLRHSAMPFTSVRLLAVNHERLRVDARLQAARCCTLNVLSLLCDLTVISARDRSASCSKLETRSVERIPPPRLLIPQN